MGRLWAPYEQEQERPPSEYERHGWILFLDGLLSIQRIDRKRLYEAFNVDALLWRRGFLGQFLNLRFLSQFRGAPRYPLPWYFSSAGASSFASDFNPHLSNGGAAIRALASSDGADGPYQTQPLPNPVYPEYVINSRGFNKISGGGQLCRGVCAFSNFAQAPAEFAFWTLPDSRF